ncbi:hypothetical protein [Chlorogloeopsis sp. ULAP02]
MVDLTLVSAQIGSYQMRLIASGRSGGMTKIFIQSGVNIPDSPVISC